MPDEPRTNPWQLWQIIDSAFPVGGFAHSGGLEAAVQLNEVGDSESVEEFVTASMRQCARATAPFAIATRREPDQYLEFDAILEAMMASTVPNRASRTQGQAFLVTAGNVWENAILEQARSQLRQGFYGHLAVVFGLVASVLNIEINATADMFLYLHARGILSAAVRLNVVGPIEAQRIQHRLTNLRGTLLDIAIATPVDEATQSSPLLDLFQAQHERLYSRLFVT